MISFTIAAAVAMIRVIAMTDFTEEGEDAFPADTAEIHPDNVRASRCNYVLLP